jgi:hypothetical protein
MATPTELYINAELPKRPYTAQYPLTAGHVPVATGIGLEISARQLDVTDVANAASEQYVNDAIDALVDGAPAALDTLNELAAAINDDENYAGTVTTALGNRLRVDVDTQGLTNTEKQNGLDNLGITEVITDASIDAAGVITFSKNTGQASDTVQIPTAVDDITFNSSTGEMTIGYTNGVADSVITVVANEVADNVFRIKDNVDETKKIAFEASDIATGTTKTITMPNTNVDLGQIPYIQLIDQSITYHFGNVPAAAKYTKYVISASCIPTINLTAFTSRLRQIEVFNASNNIVYLTLQDTRTITYSSGGPISPGIIYMQPGTSISIGIGKSGFNDILVSESTDAVALLTPAIGSITGEARYAKLRFIEANGNFSIGAYTLGGIGYTIIAAKENSTITLNNQLGSVSYLNLATNSSESPLVLSKGEIAYIFPNNSFVRIAEKNRFYTSQFRLKKGGGSLLDPPPYADNTVGFDLGFDWIFSSGVNRTITIPNKDVDLSNIGRVPGYTNPTAYVTGDVVAYNGQEFRCRTTHTSSTAEPDYTKFTPVSGTLHITNASASVTPPINPDIKSVEIRSQSDFTLFNTDVTAYPVKITSTGNGINVNGSPTSFVKDGLNQNMFLGYAESATVTNGNRWATGQNEFTDNVFRVKDNVDGTKKIAFEASGIAAATTRTITMPDVAVNLGTIPVIHSANGNSVTGTNAAITSGLTNTASGQYSSVLNGTLNTASGKHGTILSGQSNTANIDQTILSGRNITGVITTGAVIHGGIVEGIPGTEDALGTTVVQYTLRGRIVPAATNWILANGSTNAAVSAAVTTATSIKGALSTTTIPDIVNAVGIHDITFMILGSSGSPKPMLAGQRRAMVYYDGTTYTLDTVQTIGTDHSFGGITSALTVGLTPSAPFGLLTFQVTNNEAANIVVNISVKSTYNNYQ